MRVGTAVVVVPLHHPLVIAEEIATLDLLSGGRLDVGLGRGYQRYEFERLGLQLDSGGERWEESIDILLKAFEGRPFTYEGRRACCARWSSSRAKSCRRSKPARRITGQFFSPSETINGRHLAISARTMAAALSGSEPVTGSTPTLTRVSRKA